MDAAVVSGYAFSIYLVLSRSWLLLLKWFVGTMGSIHTGTRPNLMISG